MSVDLIKSISIDPIRKTVSVTSAANNVTPRTYESWNPLGSGSPFTFESWLEAFASDCFGGSSQFLPSCESLAHEAYLKTCDEMGGDWSYAYQAWTFYSPMYDDFKKCWCEKFIGYILADKRDRRKFHMTCGGHTVNVYVRRSPYGGLSGHYRYSSYPKSVSWIRQAVIRRNWAKFDSVAIA